MIDVQNLRRGMVVSDADDTYKVYRDAECIDGTWQCEVTTSGEYAWTLMEGDVVWPVPVTPR